MAYTPLSVLVSSVIGKKVTNQTAKSFLKGFAQGNTETTLKKISITALRKRLFNVVDEELKQKNEFTKYTNFSSSNVKDFGYNENKLLLSVNFLGGGPTYYYFGVSKYIYKSFISAPSKGQFVWRKLRGKFPFEKR